MHMQTHGRTDNKFANSGLLPAVGLPRVQRVGCLPQQGATIRLPVTTVTNAL
jgi:hypothetical protein